MPRFVRPAFMDAGADGRASRVRIGPRSRDGFLSGRITLRTPEATVSDPPITFDAGGQDDTGRARFVLTIPEGPYVVEYEGNRYHGRIVVRPTGPNANAKRPR